MDRTAAQPLVKLRSLCSNAEITRLESLLKGAIHCEKSLKVGMKEVAKMTNDSNRLQTVVIDVILSLNFAAILHKIYFLFRLLQLNEQSMACRIGNVLLTFQLSSSASKFSKICPRFS